jgi:hypothetical protein
MFFVFIYSFFWLLNNIKYADFGEIELEVFVDIY